MTSAPQGRVADPDVPGRSDPVQADMIVRVEGLTKHFGNVSALAGVGFDIPEGAFFSLLGPSGCGKTTLLRILAGLEQPDGGDVLLDGASVLATPPERRPFNIVFQRYALFPHMTVEQNVAFGLTTRGRGRGRARQEVIRGKVEEMLALIGLAEYGGRTPSQLSGGQAQRVALARALITEPRVLLLDEPLSALDQSVRQAMRDHLLRIHNELGTTFVLVTHDQEEALSMSTTVALMNDGRVEQVASPEELYRNPATPFAARFIGAGAMVGGRVEGRAGAGVRFVASGVSWTPRTAGPVTDGAATVLLRPEEIRVVDPAGARVHGTVQTSVFLGSSHLLAATTPVGELRLRADHGLAPGTAVGLGWSDTAGICYADTGGDLARAEWGEE